MPVSDAQFEIFLKGNAKKVILSEQRFAFESSGNIAIGTVYFSKGLYATGPADSPPNQKYFDAINSLSYDIAVEGDKVEGEAKFSVSDLVLDNADGRLDFLLSLVVDGYENRCYIGGEGWARSDFRLCLVTVAERVVAPDEKQIIIKLRSKGLLLDREIKGNPVGGSGPNATKYLPLIFGSHENLDLSGFMYDEATLVYSVLSNYGFYSQVPDVRDKGGSLRSAAVDWTAGNTTANAGTDVVTHVAHGLQVDDVVYWREDILGADDKYTGFVRWHPFNGFPETGLKQVWVKTVPTLDTVTFSLTKGGATLDITGTTWNPGGGGIGLKMIRQRWYDDTPNTGRIQLSSKAAGRPTCDVYNADWINGKFFVDPSEYERLPFNLAAGLMLAYGGVASTEVDSTAADAADTALDAKVAVGFTSLKVVDRKNLIVVLRELVNSVFGWFGDDNLGKITFGLLDPSGLANATATRTLINGDATGDISCENIAPSISRANINYLINNTVQGGGELLPSLIDAIRTKYGAPFGAVQRSTAPSGTAYATNKPLYHKAMTEGEPLSVSMSFGTFSSLSGASLANYSDEIVEDLTPHLRVVNWPAGIDKYSWKLGEVVSVTHLRHGLANGKKARIRRMHVELAPGEGVTLGLLTHMAPNVGTGSY